LLGFAAVFVLDPRFFDSSPYGRVTDPKFEKSIPTRRPISFGNRKCSAQRAHFILQCLRELSQELASQGVHLHVCYGLPEDVLEALPAGSSVYCQQEPVSVECTDIENDVEAKLGGKSSSLIREWGAMSLYHREDYPFRLEEGEMPTCFTELGCTLGWDDIWSVPDRSSWAAPVRSPVRAPATYPKTAEGLDLPGLLTAEVLADVPECLRRLGYSKEEIEDALSRDDPLGGEQQARKLFEAWLARQGLTGDNPQDHSQAPVFWDLPVGNGPGEGHDALQWANLARPHGWTRISQHLAVGCISAREIFARTASCPNFNGVVHRLLWRELHRLNAIRFGRRLFWLQGPGWVERPWTSDATLSEAWKFGRTGIPYVDACMRELQQTGWLAYKGRKTAAFVLVFGMGVDWRIGAYIFEEFLLDYDCAMNYGNWITVAAVEKPRRHEWHEGATVEELVEAYRSDVQMKLSAEMANDPAGEYIRRWVPELHSVSDAFVHMPWAMSPEEMEKCSCRVGQDYPAPLTGSLHLSTSEEELQKEGSLEDDGKEQLREDDGKEQSVEDDGPCEGQDAERRVHPKDFTNTPYTKLECIKYARSLGKSKAWGEELWEQGAPAAEDGAKVENTAASEVVSA